MRRILISIAVFSLLAGCSSEPEPTAGGGETGTAPAGMSEEAAKRQAAEKMVADCMRGKGFQYEVPPPLDTRLRSAEFVGLSSVLKTDDEIRPLRQKYGFAVYSPQVYPNDPMVAKPKSDPNRNPNNKIYDALDDARKKAYDAAMGGAGSGSGCVDEAYGKYFGTAGQRDDTVNKQRAYEKFRTDPAVVRAAQKWADCLRGKGYQVKSAEPGRIENEMRDLVNQPIAAGKTVSDAEARRQLPKEIEAAVADLDCRGDYAEIARTKYAKVITDGPGAAG